MSRYKILAKESKDRVMVRGVVVRTSYARIKDKVKNTFMVAVDDVSDDRFIREHYWFIWKPLVLIWQPCNLLCKFYKRKWEWKVCEYSFIF